MKHELCISRTTDDKAMERQVELSRGNRFEEPIFLTIYDAETENKSVLFTAQSILQTSYLNFARKSSNAYKTAS